jgi:hypothetical protein
VLGANTKLFGPSIQETQWKYGYGDCSCPGLICSEFSVQLEDSLVRRQCAPEILH